MKRKNLTIKGGIQFHQGILENGKSVNYFVSKVSNPTYEVSDIKYDYPIYYVNESVKEETELYS